MQWSYIISIEWVMHQKLLMWLNKLQEESQYHLLNLQKIMFKTLRNKIDVRLIKVHVTEKINFQSEEMKVIGNLFKLDNNKGTPLPAVLVAGAMTGVKEQVAGHYAERIAKADYVTLAIDHRHFGESEGMPRQHEDPAKK